MIWDSFSLTIYSDKLDHFIHIESSTDVKRISFMDFSPLKWLVKFNFFHIWFTTLNENKN